MSETDQIKGWTVVNDGGDVESDSSSSGFVHLEPDQVVSYHHKSSRSPSLESDESLNGETEAANPEAPEDEVTEENSVAFAGDEATLNSEGGASSGCEEDADSIGDDEQPQQAQDVAPESTEAPTNELEISIESIDDDSIAVSDDEGRNNTEGPGAEGREDGTAEESCARSPSPDTLDMVVVSALTASSKPGAGDVFCEDVPDPKEGDDTEQEDHTENSASTETSEPGGLGQVWEDNMWFWDEALPAPVTDEASSAGSPIDLHLSQMELSSQERGKSSSSSEIEELEMPEDEDDELVYEELHGEMPLVPPNVAKLQMETGAVASESESELSDIVRLDPSLSEEVPLCAERRRYFPAADLMQASASSSSSSSSAGSRFHFVQPLPVPPSHHRYVYPRGNDQEDDESLPGDIDDRCESDISGVAPDDNDPDLSSVSYNLDDLEIYEGDVVRSYKHKPNSSLNSFLTTLALLTLFTTIGIGIGHYLGTVRDTGRRDQQTTRMMEIQDEYLRCLRHQEVLQAQISVTDHEKIAAVTAVWKDKYEELIIEKVELESTMRKLQDQMSDDFSLAQQNILIQRDSTHDLENELNNLRNENDQFQETTNLLLATEGSLRKENHQHLESIKKLKEREMELVSEIQLTKEILDAKQESDDLPKETNLEQTEPPAHHESTSQLTNTNLPVVAEDTRAEVPVPEPPLRDRDLKSLQNQVNTLVIENQELRTQVARLRYSQRQYTVQEVDESLKDEANRLANENEDLKSVVGKLRYGQKSEQEGEDTPKFENPEPASLPSASEHQQPHSSKDEGSPCRSEPTANPSFSACLAMFYPDVHIADLQKLFSQSVIPTLTDPIKAQVEFLRNITKDAKLSEMLAEKWTQLKDVVDTPQTNDMTQKVQRVIEDLQETVVSRWRQLNKYVRSDVEEPTSERPQEQDVSETSDPVEEGFSDMEENSQDTKESSKLDTEESDANAEKEAKGKFSSFMETISNSSAMAKYQEFVNKTKESVSKLTKKIEKTWSKVKNLTGGLLQENKPLKDFGNSINKNLNKIKKSVESGWKKAQKHMVKKGWLPKSRRSSKKKKHRKNKEPQRFRGNMPHEEAVVDQSHLDGTGGSIPMTNLRNVVQMAKEINNEPNHKQSSTAEDKMYEEYWKTAQFEPDDFFEEGFFEGNNRKWHKHQKKIRKLHGRLDRLNENILMAMDDDDIEDFYEDFDDMQDDMDDVHLPERLMTWLTCQVRWWKSRLVRKHSNEDLVKGCSRQLMPWQLRALCNPTCGRHGSKKCRKGQQQQRGNPDQGPFCHYYMTVILPSMSNQGIQEVDSSETFKDSQHKVLTVTLDETNQKVVGDMNNNYGHLHYDLSYDDLDYDHREPTVADNNATEEVEAKSSGDTKDQAKWVFERAQDRESRHHDASWEFKRKNIRAFERNKPWYLKRADHRADERSRDSAKHAKNRK